MSDTHALRRTSPKGPGEKFIGTCIKCGKTGLPSSAVTEECDNPAGMETTMPEPFEQPLTLLREREKRGELSDSILRKQATVDLLSLGMEIITEANKRHCDAIERANRIILIAHEMAEGRQQ